MQEPRREQQIETLLRHPGVGPLPVGAIARNLGASPQQVQPLLERLTAEGRLLQLDDGRFSTATRLAGGG